MILSFFLQLRFLAFITVTTTPKLLIIKKQLIHDDGYCKLNKRLYSEVIFIF